MQVIDVPTDHRQSPSMVATAVRPGGERSVSVLGVRVEILLTGKETGGVYSLYRMVAEPGAGAPPHLHHKDDEAFTVIEGMFECGCGDTVLTLGAGATISLPRGVPHYFRCVGETPGIMLGIGTPAGHEKFFEEAAQMAFPPNPVEAAAVCARHGMELLLPPGSGQ